MANQITLKTAVPLLATWGSDDRIQAASSNPMADPTPKKHLQLQAIRWSTAIAIDRDFEELLQYIAPSDKNLSCHSSRVLALLIRVCVEIESCFKSILSNNNVSESKQKNICYFSVVENSHSLSRFKTRIHGWREDDIFFTPFEEWDNNSCKSPKWYQAYSKVKHNALDARKYATFGNLCLAISGLHVLLVSQFGRNGWGPSRGGIPWYSAPEYECSVGATIEVRFPLKSECKVIYDLPRVWNYDIAPFEY